MIKKTLLTLSVIVTASQALTLDFTKKGLYAETGKKIIYTSTENMNPGKDWMGIYKKGDSTNWNNVIDWKWVKDLPCHNPSPCHDVYKMPDLGQGDYEIRYFKNNSYTISASKDFKITGDVVNSINLKSITTPYYNEDKKTIYVELRGDKGRFKPNAKDWIGLYKVGDRVAWINVKKWTWAKNFENAPGNNSYYQFKNVSLEAGKYEVRYFLNNTGMTFKKSEPFEIKNSSDNTTSILNEAKRYCSSKEKRDETIICKGDHAFVIKVKPLAEYKFYTTIYHVTFNNSSVKVLKEGEGTKENEITPFTGPDYSFDSPYSNSNGFFWLRRASTYQGDLAVSYTLYYLDQEVAVKRLVRDEEKNMLSVDTGKIYDNGTKLKYSQRTLAQVLEDGTTGNTTTYTYDISNPLKPKLINTQLHWGKN